jgi:hypothetical protein
MNAVDISTLVKLAAAYKRSKGEGWAHAPYGQRKDDGGKLVDDVGECEVVGDVLALRGEGLSIRAIVDEMNARGVSTRDGGRFHIATVQRILKRA